MLKAFRFRLERLLDYRRLRKDLARAQLEDASREVREQNAVLMAGLREDHEGKSALRELKQSRILDISQLRLQEGYLTALERRIRGEFDRLQQRTRVEAEKRKALTEARKDVLVLERLRERQERAHRYKEDREEQKFLDEVGQKVRRKTS